jgi:hypothetical protein
MKSTIEWITLTIVTNLNFDVVLSLFRLDPGQKYLGNTGRGRYTTDKSESLSQLENLLVILKMKLTIEEENRNCQNINRCTHSCTVYCLISEKFDKEA